ncbi:MAG TPA: NAD(P)/FAD-dependent oxidoreductase [Stackebrandtia sp.]|jgi:2-polyprenyl-6-methoxyphenol hydroxylase-like FAD-dependent oxidoreductase|uniref:FAD-dependent oxidoreductase n=1 Tax=Stackebrandtia sp. TaxID=2023065 RepID=UPI002D48E241|nr:NAD(P)/FAD-dependent oxidoreductase [Stackebrandtia sp.]HZE37547.1 NAD(P)/FAD-dependent oxidoreductase [Stackebrandtia sp.]
MKISRALVIGGGIAGPVTALALHKAGIEAAVYEAYETTAEGVGGFLGFAPNGLSALAVVGADAAVTAVSEATPVMIMENHSGRQIARVDASSPGVPDNHLVDRAALYRVLMEAVRERGIEVHTGKRLVDADETDGRVTARFSDGSSATGDVLVGCDGIRSTVRELIDPNAPTPRYTGLLGFGAPVEGQRGEPNAMHFAFGRRAFFGYQYFADGSAGWFANLPRKEYLTAREMRQTPAAAWLAEIAQRYEGDRMIAAEMLARTKPADLFVSGPLEDVPTVPRWYSERMVLVGDSAHATSPSSGQGASLACESAVELARCLRDRPSLVDAFTTYEAKRRERVEYIIARAANVNQQKAAGPVARVFRDLAMPMALKLVNPRKMFAKQYGYRIDWEATA